MQGDVLSAILFIFYLAKCLRKPIKTNMKGFLSTPKYVDDITYAGTSQPQDELEVKVPVRLNEYDLSANETKTEKYQIPKPPPPAPPNPSMEKLIAHKEDKPLWSELDWFVNYRPEIKDKTPDWTNCKLLGSKLDTEKDFQRRKRLTIDSMREMDYIYKSKSLSIQTKTRTFNAFASSVFLYNLDSDYHPREENRLISTTYAQASNKHQMAKEDINCESVHQNEARKLEQNNNEKTFKLAWSYDANECRTPVRKALDEALRPVKKKRGKPPTTWLKVMEKDLHPIVNLALTHNTPDQILTTLTHLTQDRKNWSHRIKDIMESNL